MIRPTPRILERDGNEYSAISKSLVFQTNENEDSVWIPKDQANEYIEEKNTQKCSANGSYSDLPMVTTRIDVDVKPKSIARYSVDRNCEINASDSGFDCYKNVVVNNRDFYKYMDDTIIRFNGTHKDISILGFNEVDVRVCTFPPDDPHPEDTMRFLTVCKNGEFNVEEETGYKAAASVTSRTPQPFISEWTKMSIHGFAGMDADYAACFYLKEGHVILHMFKESSETIIDFTDGTIRGKVLPFSADKLSAFYVNDTICLVGCLESTGDPVFYYRRDNENVWENGIASLPQYCQNPNIVQEGDRVFIIGSGTGLEGSDCYSKGYELNTNNMSWFYVFDLPMSVIESDNPVCFNGKINIWKNGVHKSCNIYADTYMWRTVYDSEENDLFMYGDSCVAAGWNFVYLVGSEGSSFGNIQSIARYREVVAGDDVLNPYSSYDIVDWTPYEWRNAPGMQGQRAFCLPYSNDLVIIGQTTTESTEIYVLHPA